MHASFPGNPVAAVTHPNPYPYYAELAARRPLYRDDGLNCWVAAGAAAVEAVLADDRCRVRPPAEPVPRAVVGSAAGDLFGRLVRMNDGDAHRRRKPAVVARLAALDPADAFARTTTIARQLVDAVPPVSGAAVTAFASQLPVLVVASLLGVGGDALARVPAWTGDLVRSFANGATQDDAQRGSAAASALLATFAARNGIDDAVANEVGFLSQTYDATAGLIGNTLLALAADGARNAAAAADPSTLAAVVEATLRDDPPIQNTRRFLTLDATIAGCAMRAGDVVLVVLAAANRDPAARASYTFGTGPHACPGTALASAIACAGIAQLLAAGLDPTSLGAGVTYRPSANARIPQFAARSMPHS